MNMPGFIQQVKNKVHLRLWHSPEYHSWLHVGCNRGLDVEPGTLCCMFISCCNDFSEAQCSEQNWITNSFGHVPWHRFQGPLNVGLDSLLSTAGVISSEGRTRSHPGISFWSRVGALETQNFCCCPYYQILSSIFLKKRFYRVWNSNCSLPRTLVRATAVPVVLWVFDQSIHQSALSIKHFKNNAVYWTNETQWLAWKRPLLALRTTN